MQLDNVVLVRKFFLFVVSYYNFIVCVVEFSLAVILVILIATPPFKFISVL